MPRIRLPHAVPYIAALADSMVSSLLQREPRIPMEGVRMARHKMFVDCTKARKALEFHPGSLEAALERAIHWYSDHGYLKVPLRTPVASAHAA
jgi:dihydroflavonol-4-reductase